MTPLIDGAMYRGSLHILASWYVKHRGLAWRFLVADHLAESTLTSLMSTFLIMLIRHHPCDFCAALCHRLASALTFRHFCSNYGMRREPGDERRHNNQEGRESGTKRENGRG